MSCHATCYVTAHLEALVCHPDSAVALEAAAKAELPDLVSLADALEGLDVGQDIPAAAWVLTAEDCAGFEPQI
jgi:hypothetical protein